MRIQRKSLWNRVISAIAEAKPVANFNTKVNDHAHTYTHANKHEMSTRESIGEPQKAYINGNSSGDSVCDIVFKPRCI